jgi:hypothetical protein
MPRIKGIPGSYRFFFTSFDCNEPAHVHVEHELNAIRRIITVQRDNLLRAWHEHCG